MVYEAEVIRDRLEHARIALLKSPLPGELKEALDELLLPAVEKLNGSV